MVIHHLDVAMVHHDGVGVVGSGGGEVQGLQEVGLHVGLQVRDHVPVGAWGHGGVG